MKQTRIPYLMVALLAVFLATETSKPAGNPPQAQQSPPPTVASAADRDISAVEKQILDVADAMPA